MLMACNENKRTPSKEVIDAINFKRGEVVVCGTADKQFGSVQFKTSCSEDVQDEFDVVVVAVGFGQELHKAVVAPECMTEGPSGRKTLGAYWEPDALENTLGSQPILVSGAGDGALIDLARALIGDFRHDAVVTKTLGDSRLVDVRRRIREIDGAQAQREQLFDVVERGLALHLLPAFGLDDVTRAHRPAVVAKGGFRIPPPDLTLLTVAMPAGVHWAL